jgi:hypothetical protein
LGAWEVKGRWWILGGIGVGGVLTVDAMDRGAMEWAIGFWVVTMGLVVYGAMRWGGGEG